jgi:DNA-binding NtrC family response regulator
MADMADSKTTPPASPGPETVLVVDDDALVLASVRALLALETPYHVVTCATPAAALEWLEAHDAGVVVSDYLMPGLDGITLLGRARALRPEVPRVLLTGYADKENAIRAINEVGLYHYLEKPWRNDDLLLVVRNAVEKRALVARLREKIDEASAAHAELAGLRHEILKAFA